MSTIISEIPDVEDFLALSTEELAFVFLKLANEHKQHNNQIHPQVLLSQVDGTPGMNNGYPSVKKREVEIAFSEAWNWLKVQGIVISTIDINGQNGYVSIARKGKDLLDKDKFSSYSKSIGFPRSLLHPSIAQEVWIDLARGDPATAIFKAFKEVEIAVRTAGGFSADDVGVKMMRAAFHPDNGPLTNLEDVFSEREALMHLFSGAIGRYKNPGSHREVTIDDLSDAQEQVVLASQLLRIVEGRSK